MSRVFIYDDREFPDPDPNLSVEDVRQSMTTFFPELANADTTGPVKRNGDDLYTFKRRTGTKGGAVYGQRRNTRQGHRGHQEGA